MSEINVVDIYKLDDNYQIQRSPVLAKLDYIFDEELSNDDMHIYYKKLCETVIIMINGLNATIYQLVFNLKVDITSIHTILRYVNDRCVTAKEIYRKINIKYPFQKQISIGHSLGGTIASKFTSKDSTIYTFNKLIFKPNHDIKNLINFRTYFDPVSLLTLLFENKYTTNLPFELPNDFNIDVTSLEIVKNIGNLLKKAHYLQNFKDIKIVIP